MNITADHATALPPGVTLDAVLELGAALGRQAAAAFLADDAAGLTPGQRRRAEAETFDGIEHVEAAVLAVERLAAGAGDTLASALRAAMLRWCEAHAAGLDAG